MPQKRLVELHFPVGGLHRAASYQRQPPYTTPDCLNVRPRDTQLGRERGGSRPGLAKAYYTQLGSGNPVRMLGTVSFIRPDGLTFTADSFLGSALSSSDWIAASWIGASLPGVLPLDYAQVAFGTAAGAVHAAIAEMDTTLPYWVGVYIVPYQGAHHGSYQIFVRMNTTTPVATTDGVVVELVMTGATGAWTGTAKTYKTGTGLTNTYNCNTTGSPAGAPESGWFAVLVTPGSPDNIKVYWMGRLLLNQTLAAGDLGGSAGVRTGFGMSCTVAGGVTLADEFRINYRTNTNAQTLVRQLVASANGVLYAETYPGEMGVVVSNLTLASDRQLQCAERYQKLYIADNGNPAAVGTDGAITAGVLDSASVADWTALGINIYDYVVVVSGGVAGNSVGTWPISTIHATNGLTLTGCATTDTGCTFRVERGPKIYDPVLGSLTAWVATAGKGQVPTGCQHIACWHDRLFLGGHPVAPHAWYACRSNDTAAQPGPLDWYYITTVSDGGRPIAGTNLDAAQLTGPMTAMAPHSHDYLMMGCADSLWVQAGDPAYGGELQNLSHKIGIVDAKAWCFGPGGEFVFLSRAGLHVVASGSGPPQSISWERLPRELQDFAAGVFTISLAFDARDKGVHVFLTPAGSSQTLHWWVDWGLKGFWPMRLTGTHDPTCILDYTAANASDSAVLLGCRDGYIRRFKDDQETDDSVAFANYIMYGPIATGDAYNDGLLNELAVTLGRASGSLTVTTQAGESPEHAVFASTFASFTANAGVNYRFRPRMRGDAIVKLAGSGTRRWSVEQVMMVLERLGTSRKA